MVLKILHKLTLDVVDKDLRIFEVFSEKSFEVRLCNKSNTLVALLVLGLSEADNAMEK